MSTIIGSIMYLCFALLVMRGMQTSERRKIILMKLELYCSEDWSHHFPWEWRIDEFQKIGFWKMYFAIGKKPEDLYRDKRFLNPEVKVIKQPATLA